MVLSTLEPVIKNNLFSKYYLENLIHKKPEWNRTDHRKIFRKIKEIYEEEKQFLKDLNEPQLEERFYRKIFNIILPDFEVQLITKDQEFPDYAFFPDKKSLDSSHINKGTKSFYRNAFAIGEVKRWDTELNKFGKDKHNKRRNPSFQIWLYLHQTYPKWGILSNGRKWRLYHEDKPLDVYYEIDLVSLLENDDIDGFKYFYYFFNKVAFIPSESGEIFLESVLRESSDYAKEIGDNLKENIYKAMKIISDGFFNWPRNQLNLSEEKLRLEVQKSSMRLLYRFLFLLYAEGKGLLNLSNERYLNQHSFRRITREIAYKKDGPDREDYSLASTTLWSKLRDLFRLIDQGSEKFGIPKDDFYIPAYNGGLFSPEKNPNLEEWVIEDIYLAAAIDLLARSETNGGDRGFVDYSTLEIRHLGNIYEGLLEYNLKKAKEDMVVKTGKKKKEWITLEDYNEGISNKKSLDDFDNFDKVQAGEIYLSTDKGERKLTGSYYTPDFIVNYIVKNTLEPIVERSWKESLRKKETLINATLSIKVLDPAMGSGHFLVGAVEFLAGKLLEAAQKDIERGHIKDDGHFTIDWAKREVVSHCIYGVDLNDLAVELAKVSLWLTTISKHKPLSFLDHRLKQGNSLIGTHLSDLKYYPKEKKRKELSKLPSFISPIFIKHLIGKISELEQIRDETLDDIKKKEQVFEEFKQLPEYKKAKELANVYTSIYFGNEVSSTNTKSPANVYYDLLYAIMGNEAEWKTKTKGYWFEKAKIIAQEKSFFHWELEFPDIYFESGAPRKNPGWDAVIGNPPWGALLHDEDLKYLDKKFEAKGWNDSYAFFMQLFVNICSDLGTTGMIVPSSWLTVGIYKKIREFMLVNGNFSNICYLYRVFEDVNLDEAIFIHIRKSPEINTKIKIAPVDISVSKRLKLLSEQGWEKSFITPNSIWRKNPDFRIDVLIDPPTRKIIEKIDEVSISLSELYEIGIGIQAYCRPKHTKEQIEKRIYHSKNKVDDTYMLCLSGNDVGRYEIHSEESEYLSVGEWLYFVPELEVFYEPRILAQQVIWKTLKTCLVKEKNLAHYNSIFHIYRPKKKYSLEFANAVLNSYLMAWIFPLKSNKMFGEKFPKLSHGDLCNLPIRQISFNTPKDQRLKLVNEGKKLFSEFLESTDNLSKMLIFIEDRLNGKNKESDVVHDLLSYVSKKMILMISEKNKEIKDFLKWLEGEIGINIEKLKNKTYLKEYYNNNFDSFLEVLIKNKKNLKENYDPTRREPKEKIQTEFDNSLDKLIPLLNRIENTSWIIDQIVYKLYGLTIDDIRTVESTKDR